LIVNPVRLLPDFFVLGIIVCGVAGTGAGAARADVKVVSRVAVTGGTKAAPPEMVTTSYKGKVVRTETSRMITLFNTETQSVTALNKADNTYRVVSLKDNMAKVPGLMSRMRFSTKANMEPQDGTKMIAGKPARKYVGTASMKMIVDGMPKDAAPETTMEIEQWTTDAVVLPPDCRDMMSPVTRLTGSLPNMPGMKPLVDALSQIKGTPLSSKVTVTVTGQSGSSSMARGPIVTTTDVVSITQLPLSADLFKVPAGYKKLESRSVPTFPKNVNRQTHN
jgi:hypothetical protein